MRRIIGSRLFRLIPVVAIAGAVLVPALAHARGGGGGGVSFGFRTGGFRGGAVIHHANRQVFRSVNIHRRLRTGFAGCSFGRATSGCFGAGFTTPSSVTPPLVPPVVPPLGPGTFSSFTRASVVRPVQVWRLESGVWHQASANRVAQVWRRGADGTWHVDGAG